MPCVASTTSTAPSHAASARAYFIVEVHVPRRIDEVEHIAPAVRVVVKHAHGGRFDRNAALTLDIHGVEQLLLHIAFLNGIRQFHHPVGSVDFPWSICAMIEKLRISSLGYAMQIPPTFRVPSYCIGRRIAIKTGFVKRVAEKSGDAVSHRRRTCFRYSIGRLAQTKFLRQ
jgi:hypothetical protein